MFEIIIYRRITSPIYSFSSSC